MEDGFIQIFSALSLIYLLLYRLTCLRNSPLFNIYVHPWTLGVHEWTILQIQGD